MRLMLDTNIFNRIAQGTLAVESFAGDELFATHVQRDELLNAPKPLRDALIATFHILDPRIISTDTAIWGDSRWNETKWSSADGKYESILKRIQILDGKDRGLNQSRDARIAEVAINSSLTLVTDDGNLRIAASEHGCNVTDLARYRVRRDALSS